MIYLEPVDDLDVVEGEKDVLDRRASDKVQEEVFRALPMAVRTVTGVTVGRTGVFGQSGLKDEKTHCQESHPQQRSSGRRTDHDARWWCETSASSACTTPQTGFNGRLCC